MTYIQQFIREQRMSKRRNTRLKKTKFPSGKKLGRPDRFMKFGPFELAQAGRYVTMRNTMSPQEFQKLQDDLAARYPVVCQEIDNLIAQIVAIVSELPPAEVLKRAYWGMAGHLLNIKSESEIDSEGVISVRMVDYLQSIIASAKPTEITKESISEETWEQLRSLVASLFAKLRFAYPVCHRANRQMKTFEDDPKYDDIYYQAQQYWVNVRGQRYLINEIPALRDLLKPHDEVLKELFGISTDQLIDGICAIQDSLTIGIEKVIEDFDAFRKAVTEKFPNMSNDIDGLPIALAPSEVVSRLIEENGWQEWRDSILGRLFGLSLFDLDLITRLPKSLLDELSWEPGQEPGFLENSPLNGWPLKIWPIFTRPFIKLEGRHYCFDLYNLFDHFYRIMERTLMRLKPQYREEWNRKQKELTERLPFNLFGKLLPGSKIYRPVFYKDQNNRWCELDGLLIFEDHLFVVEIRAGAFTYTSPATDYHAYIESVKNLLLKPVEQGRRFLEYLNLGESVQLFNENRSPIAEISKKDFEHITICAISLDAFTELAARAQHLKNIGVDVGKEPVWSISLDNLREYAEIFNNPLVFVHYIEERMRAFQSELVSVDDELDHLGLYLRHNAYTRHTKEILSDGVTRLKWFGYRAKIDEYFNDLFFDPSGTHTLEQTTPSRIREIIKILSIKSHQNRRKTASTLLDCGDEARERINNGIEESLLHQSQKGRMFPLSLYGETKITIVCWQEGVLPQNFGSAQLLTKAAMTISGDAERLLLELVFNEKGTLTEVYPTFITASDISPGEASGIKEEAEKLRLSRVRAAINGSGKIGRNELCPCGSGKKYKRCCLLESQGA